MQAAADADIAPRIHYASIANRLLLTDFVEARPFPADVIPAIAKLRYAKVHIAEALRHMRSPRFAQALAVVRAG